MDTTDDKEYIYIYIRLNDTNPRVDAAHTFLDS